MPNVVQVCPPQDGPIEGGVALAQSACILLEGYIQHPVQRVFAPGGLPLRSGSADRASGRGAPRVADPPAVPGFDAAMTVVGRARGLDHNRRHRQ